MIRLKEKGLIIMTKLFKISALVTSLIFISCEIPENLNDNPNDLTVSDVDANLFLNGAQLANNIVQVSHLNRISGMFSGQLVGYASYILIFMAIHYLLLKQMVNGTGYILELWLIQDTLSKAHRKTNLLV